MAPACCIATRFGPLQLCTAVRSKHERAVPALPRPRPVLPGAPYRARTSYLVPLSRLHALRRSPRFQQWRRKELRLALDGLHMTTAVTRHEVRNLYQIVRTFSRLINDVPQPHGAIKAHPSMALPYAAAGVQRAVMETDVAELLAPEARRWVRAWACDGWVRAWAGACVGGQVGAWVGGCVGMRYRVQQ